MSQTNQKGFTLVEMAIVLVIIGLLLGGVLKGQELIANSKIKATESEIQQWVAAIYTYQDKRGQLPGDDSTATNKPGNGNGYIDNAERAPFFEHLKDEGLIKGGYTGAANDYAKSKWGGNIVPYTNVAGLSGVSMCYFGLDKSTATTLDKKLDDGSGITGSVRNYYRRAYGATNNIVCFKM